MSLDKKFAFQKLDIYVAARELVQLVHQARIRDAEFRDQGTRAAKSVFCNIGEGLPSRSTGVRRKYFETAQGSLFETVTAVDGADAVGAIERAHIAPIMACAHRVDAMLRGLLG